MEAQQQKADKVNSFYYAINQALSYDRAGAWLEKHCYDVSWAINEYKRLHNIC